MQQFVCSIAILAVTIIYLFWRVYLQATHRRERLLRERIAYLLWVAADVDEFALSTAGVEERSLDKTLDVT